MRITPGSYEKILAVNGVAFAAARLGFNSLAGLRTVLLTTRHRCDISSQAVLSRRGDEPRVPTKSYS